MPMSRLAQNPHVTLLADRLKPLGVTVEASKLYRVLEYMGWDVDLAQTAFVLQPKWLTDLIGPKEAQGR
jgi:hypothetical protein